MRHILNNRLISRPLIGSFLSSIRVQTDKIVIYGKLRAMSETDEVAKLKLIGRT